MLTQVFKGKFFFSRVRRAQVKLNFSLISRGGHPGSSLGDRRGERRVDYNYYFKSCLLDKESPTFSRTINSARSEFNLKNHFWLMWCMKSLFLLLLDFFFLNWKKNDNFIESLKNLPRILTSFQDSYYYFLPLSRPLNVNNLTELHI